MDEGEKKKFAMDIFNLKVSLIELVNKLNRMEATWGLKKEVDKLLGKGGKEL